ncbi:putative flippase GtrA [Scopulibacillus darangshiensis]|uniref:Putative flippase GtrA n=2 Tax=Scopulibacillus darangshiensis TaxID=442528 RepID=A0A4R2NSL6_9BACL|nr:putative flippase GtrA [Scopulibacillus darangshiensis]
MALMYILYHGTGFSYWTSTFTGNAIGACVSFYLNKMFTFQSKDPIGKNFFRFATVIVCCYGLSYGLGKSLAFFILSEGRLIQASYASDLAILLGTVLYTLTNYFGQKYFVFS